MTICSESNQFVTGLKTKATCQLKLSDSPGLDVLSLHMIYSNCVHSHVFTWLVDKL